mmetsp:Transcript_40911/g.46482  ORF Transcript_40911/g.46482 Transcript_40911/m.46482 type:complete len:203 (-) Transcript_40911:69-677(-)
MLRVIRTLTISLLLLLHVRENESLSQKVVVESRRNFIEATFSTSSLLFVTGTVIAPQLAVASKDTPPTSNLLVQIQQARKQMESVPKLIENEKWDSIRAILIEPPLADCWAKTNRPILTKFAEEVGNSGGDELAALEAREDLVSHLRYLDMAVYNNNFNPIKTEGKMNAGKALIESYYDDPAREYKASISALEQLIGLSKDS